MEPSTERATGYHSHLLTWTMCVLCLLLTVSYHVAVRMRGTGLEAIGLFGYRPVQEIWDGGYGALLTAVFIHGNPSSMISTVLHIGFNLLYLYALGCLLEETIHPVAWALFFIGASVVSSGAEIALSSRAGVGVSGVVYAMFGLLWAGRKRYPDWQIVATKRNLIVMVGWGLFCVVATWLHLLHVANAAHFAGLFFGMAVGWLVVGRHRVVSALVFCGLVALTVASVSWMPWSLPWVEWKAGRERALGHYAESVRWSRASLKLGEDPATAWSNILVTEHLRKNQAGQQAAIQELRKLRVIPEASPFTESYPTMPVPGFGPPSRQAPPSPLNWTPRGGPGSGIPLQPE